MLSRNTCRCNAIANGENANTAVAARAAQLENRRRRATQYSRTMLTPAKTSMTIRPAATAGRLGATRVGIQLRAAIWIHPSGGWS